MVYIRDSIPSNLVNLDQKVENFEGLLIELEFSKEIKWLLSYSYNPHGGNTRQHLPNISKDFDELNWIYDNTFVTGDLNPGISEPSSDEFYQIYNLESIIHKLTCFKNPKNPWCIDLVLTNKQDMFLKVKIVEIGLSHFESITK